MTECLIFRCSKQEEMYLYLRADLKPDQLPASLRQRAGRLIEVMRLQLSPTRRLARVDVARVLQQLDSRGWFLQLPPDGRVHAHLDDGD